MCVCVKYPKLKVYHWGGGEVVRYKSVACTLCHVTLHYDYENNPNGPEAQEMLFVSSTYYYYLKETIVDH